MNVLVLNCGSSSLKFDIISTSGERIASGSVDRIGPESTVALQARGARVEADRSAADHGEAFAIACVLLTESGALASVEAIGHRVVHGGATFREPVRIDDGVVSELEAVSRLAPLHNAPALEVIAAARERFPALPMVGTFDTAFYASLPEVAATYALPTELTQKHGIRRFGFHGLAHRYIVERYTSLHPDVDEPRLVTLQLGNGSSATASVGGRAVDTSMGFTPLEGLIMGTRSGDLDPSIPLFLVESAGMTPADVNTLLNRESGLLGLSGASHDMRHLLSEAAAGNERARLAVDAFCYRARKYLGAYLAALGGADAVLFGGGIGEHAPEVRGQICADMEWAGLTLDDARNEDASGPEALISAEGSSVEAWAVAVDEAHVIASDVRACLS